MGTPPTTNSIGSLISMVILGVMSAMAQHEREIISERTKAGLAAAKARGVRIGNPRLDEHRNRDTSATTAARSAKARARSADLAGVVAELEADEGRALPMREIAARLNAAGYTSPRAKTLTAMHVHRIRRAAPAMGPTP